MNIGEFYNKTVKMNEELTGGWATLYYGIFSNIINENNYKIVAEVGIGYGTHSKQILKNTNIDMLYIIDPMQFYLNDGFATDILKCNSITGNHFNDMYDLINKYLNEYNSC